MPLTRVNPTPAARPADGSKESRVEEGRFSQLPYLLYYWQIAQRFRWLICGILSACLVLALIVTLLIPPQYTARARIEVDREQKSIADVGNLDNGQSSQSTEFYQTQYALLTARPLAERVVSSLDLGNNPAFFAAHGVKLPASMEGNGPAERSARGQKAANLLLAHILVDPVKDSKLVDVKYTSRSAELSMKIANEWTRSFIDSRLDQRYSSTADARHFLEDRLNVMREKLQESERVASSYASNAGIVKLVQMVDPAGHTVSNQTLVEMALTARAASLNQAIQARVAAQAQLRSDAGDVSLDASVIGLRQARTQLAAQYAQMLVQHEKTYPAAQELDAQIKQLDVDIRSAVKRILGNRQEVYKEAMAQEVQLKGEVDDLRGQLNQQQQAGLQYNIYQREADTNRQLYDALLQRYKEIGVSGTVGASQVAIIEAALQPGAPSSPSLPKNLAFALLVGLILSGSAIFAFEHVGQSIHDPDTLADLLSLPVIGQVPMLDKGEVINALEDSKSLIFEAYVSACSALSFTTDHGVPKTLMITSTRQGEGKSTTATALALVLARKGRQVLLIDADMRAPSLDERLSERLQSIPDDGLSNYLAGDDNWARNVHATHYPGVHLLSSGPRPPSAAELLTEHRFGALLAQAAAAYDNVVIDTPPIIGLADAPVIGSMVEACLLVVEADGAAQRAIQAAVNRLLMTNTKICGTLLSQLSARYGNYSNVYYDYGDGDEAAEDDLAG